MICDLCFDEVDGRILRRRGDERLCPVCAAWADYWASLSDEDRDVEYRMMILHSAEREQ